MNATKDRRAIVTGLFHRSWTSAISSATWCRLLTFLILNLVRSSPGRWSAGSAWKIHAAHQRLIPANFAQFLHAEC